jgi:aminoglycoside phosphotransferase (APT) family kinase protein
VIEDETAGSPSPDPPDAAVIGAAMQRYLEGRGDGRGAGLQVVTCERISGGFETFIYSFRVAPVSGDACSPEVTLLPLAERLILRIYRGPGTAARSAWEAAIIGRVRQDGIPAPAVYLYEPDPAPLGGPFLVLEFLRGGRLDQVATSAGKIAVLRLLRNFARAQAAIYAVDWPEGRTLAPGTEASDLGPFAWAADRVQAARRELERRGLTQVLPVVDWLEENHHLVAGAREVLIHGDYHPLNVFAEGTRITGIIDWGAGGFANKHDDMGWSSLLIATASAADRKEDRRIAPFRTIGHRFYLASLGEACRVDGDQLRYGEVYAGLRWLMIFLPSYLPDAGPPILNSDAVAFTTPLFVRRVRRFIEKRTKLKLAIE